MNLHIFVQCIFLHRGQLSRYVVPGIELIISSLLFNEVIMGSSLDDASLLKNHATVAVSYRGKSVGNDEGGSAVHELIHTVLNHLLGTGIDGGDCLIENEHWRVCNCRPCNGKKLSLTLTQIRAVPVKRWVS